MSVPGLSSTVTQVKAGALKALAVTGAKRSPQLPNVPTLAEIKPGLILETWVGISAPPKTPPQIIAKLSSLIEQAMKDTELQAQLFSQGVTPVYERPSEITARMAKEVEMFTALSKRANISMDWVQDTEKFVRGVVGRLTRKHEATEPKPWKMGDSALDYIDGMLKAIVGIEISITRLEGKAKLSQNRENRDRLNAAEVLEKQGGPKLATAMRESKPI